MKVQCFQCIGFKHQPGAPLHLGPDGNPHDFKCTGDTTSGCSLDWSIAQQTYTLWDMSMNKEVTRKITDIEGEFELRARTLCNGRVPNAPISLMSQYSVGGTSFLYDDYPGLKKALQQTPDFYEQV